VNNGITWKGIFFLWVTIQHRYQGDQKTLNFSSQQISGDTIA